jgi:hypothetical protein
VRYVRDYTATLADEHTAFVKLYAGSTSHPATFIFFPSAQVSARLHLYASQGFSLHTDKHIHHE